MSSTSPAVGLPRVPPRLAPTGPAARGAAGPRLRVVLVGESFYPRPDDGARALRALLDHLVDLGHDPVVIAPAPGMPSYRGARVERVRTGDRPGRRVRSLLARHRPDLVHVASPGTLGRTALKHARALGIPTVVAQHAPLPGDAAGREAERFAATVLPRADAVVATCAWMAERVRDLGADDPTVWRPGVDTAAFSPAARDPWLHRAWGRSAGGDRVVVGFVGPLDSRGALRPLADVSRVPGARLVVIGDGSRRAWLAEQAPDARFAGDLRGADLATATASLDVLVHPGPYLTDAHALREAGAAGVPVVAARVGGAAEVVRDHQTGLLAEPGSTRRFVDAVQAVVADPQRARLGAAGRSAALRRTWPDAADELVAGPWATVLGASARRAAGPPAAQGSVRSS